MAFSEYKKKSILELLKLWGHKIDYNPSGGYITNSPFARDTNPSCVIYDTNTFYCWSTGRCGDIIDLIRFKEGISLASAIKELETIYKQLPNAEDTAKTASILTRTSRFDYKTHINTRESEVKAIIEYANKRSIRSGFLPGFYNRYDHRDNSYARVPSLMFLHQDINLNITGAKFRNITDESPRFSARGSLGYYILPINGGNSYAKPVCYLVESETSANSLWMFLRATKEAGAVISMGGVARPPREIPPLYRDMEQRLIIDYDGSEELYNQRLAKYSHLGCKPIKMILPKGEDINSLYVHNKMYLITHLLNQ